VTDGRRTRLSLVHKLPDAVLDPAAEGRDAGEHRGLLVPDAALGPEAHDPVDLPGGVGGPGVLITDERTPRVPLEEEIRKGIRIVLRLRSIRTKTSHHKNSFFPTATRPGTPTDPH